MAGRQDYLRANPAFGAVFNQAMTSYSAIQTQEVLAALAAEDFSRIRMLCDVGGGHGHLGCALAQAYPHLNVTILDLPAVVAETVQLWAPKLGLSERCRYFAGDMFREVPAADAFLLKFVLHDWTDAECVRILANARRAVSGAGHLCRRVGRAWSRRAAFCQALRHPHDGLGERARAH